MKIFEIFLKLAEEITGQAVEGQLARDIIWLISSLFGFWLIMLIALSPFYILREIRGKNQRR
jgi:hypothetical protein